jgi:hypothetical protein
MSDVDLSLHEAEHLCVLHALSAGPCTPAELARRLGLHPAHGPAVAEVAVGPLSALAAEADGLLALTEAGAAHLDRSLDAILGSSRESGPRRNPS